MLPSSSILCLALLLTTFSFVSGQTSHVLDSQSNLNALKSETIRLGFNPELKDPIVLLQEDGSTEDSFSIYLQLEDGGNIEDLTFIQSSSNTNVLDTSSGDADLLTSASADGRVNVTASLVFDGFVGKAEYTIIARNKTTEEDIASITVEYTIAGITFYTQTETGDITIVSGDSNKFSVSYDSALSRNILDINKIHTVIQYADGSTSTSLIGYTLPEGDSLVINLLDLKGQVVYSSANCKSSEVVSQNQDATVDFQEGCGLGFYKDSSGNLNFGLNFEPYRSGTFIVEFVWSGIGAGDTQTSDQAWVTRLIVELTGTPPVAVLSVSPADKGLWRSEGGEIFTVDIINAADRNISLLQLNVENIATPFKRLYGSEVESGPPEYKETVSFITEAGSGVSLDWTLEYQVGNADGSTGDIQTAAFSPGFAHVFNYDEETLRLDSLSPNFGSEDGGDLITLAGYFPFFDENVDGLFFSGYQLPVSYIHSVSGTEITFDTPPRSELGGAYEFDVSVGMGNAASNSEVFSFEVKDVTVRITQSGTSEIAEGVYQIGNCTHSTFTAIVTPLTNQIQSYQWSLYALGDVSSNLLSAAPFDALNSSSQTFQFDSDLLAAGAYTLKVFVTLNGKDIETEIELLREYVLAIGAFILHAPERTIAYPDSPLRLSAVVKPPGECYVGNQTMMFEWNAFDETKLFSSTNATGTVSTGSFSQTPARLGWEYVVPREQLSAGTHEIVFKVWMAEQELVSGQATHNITINRSPLVPVIRFGEEKATVNYLTSLNLFASGSYDPDVFVGDRTADITYQWSCRQSQSEDFSDEVSAPCIEALLQSTVADSFDADFSLLRSEVEIKYVQYRLQVSKGDHVSGTATLTVEIQDRGTRPFLTNYQISLTDTDGITRDWDAVAHYERAIITVSAAPAASWSYSLLEPSIPDFFSSSILIDSPLFYSAEANLFTVSGNTKPLGIEAGALSPRTTYKFKIMFDGGEGYETTSVVVSLTTLATPVIRFPVPSVTEGKTNTTFTVTAGIPGVQTAFSYYFILTDEDGEEFCLGGCTGYDVAYFRIGRPGSYSVSAYIYDMQGKALIDSQTLPQNITVTETGEEDQYLSYLDTLFATGDDNTWTQLAHDVALILLNGDSVPGTSRKETQGGEHVERDTEDLTAARMEAALAISDGARKIFCSSYPNSFHGTDCISLGLDLVKQLLLDTETVYNVMVMIECCVQNTPIRTINKMGPQFPGLLDNLNRISLSIDQGGISRRRLLQSTGEPYNLYADVQSWSSRQISASVTSGQLDGFAASYSIGNNFEYGQISVVVASHPGHLPTETVNGQQRQVVAGPSSNELFYAKDTCLSKMFTESGDKRRFLVLQTVDNFLEKGFQDPPQGTNLADYLYWQHIFEEDAEGRFVSVQIAKEDPCYCWRLPVLRRQDFLEESVEYMAGMYGVTDLKEFGVSADKGEVYTYVYEGMYTSEYSARDGWVEACQDQVGLVGSTLVLKSANNAIGNAFGTIFGTGTVALVGLVIGALVFIVVAMASIWVFAARSMADVAAPLGALAPHEMYLERDVYGRGTIFDMNAVNLPPEQSKD